MKKTSKIVALLLAVCMLLTMAFSAAAETVDTSKNLLADGRTIIRVVLTGDPGTFDPFDTGYANAITEIMTAVREGLFYVDPETLELKGLLAESVEVSEDAKTYTVKIYDYIYDSEGNHMTAEDVKWCLEKCKENVIQSSSYIESVEVLDEFTVKIQLTSSQIGVWQAVAKLPICTKAGYEKSSNFSVEPVFTGAYKVTGYVVGSSVTLEARNDYWQKPELTASVQQQNVDVIEYNIISDAAQLSIALETGKVDLIEALDSLTAARFMEDGQYAGQFNVFTYENPLSQMLYLNMDESDIFAGDENLRKALMYGIDVDAVIEVASNGYGTPAKTFGCNVLATGYLTSWDEESYFDYDADYAAQCLAASNYDGRSLRIMCSTSELHQAIAQMVQAYWLMLGINSEILPYDGALFNTYKNDAKEWDVMVDNTSIGGPIQNLWRRKFDPKNFKEGQGGANFIKGGELIDTLYLCIDESTVNDEVTNLFHEQLKELACARSLYNALNFTIGTPVVEDDYYEMTGFLVPNACTYVWNK